jgi:hypothetical protein
VIKRFAVLISAFLVIIVIVAGCPKKQPVIQKPAIPKGNVVWMYDVNANPGESFPLQVYLTNIDTLAGVQIPLFFRSDSISLICDSVSFVGSRLENFMFHDVKIPLTCPECGAKYDMYDNPPKEPGICDKDGMKLNQSDQVVFFMAIGTIDPKKDVTPLLPGEGLLATVYFTVPPNTPKGAVHLTRGMIPNNTVSLVFSVWNERGDDITGQILEGTVNIKKLK